MTTEQTPPATIERTLALLAALENVQAAAKAVLADDAEACLDLREVQAISTTCDLFAARFRDSLPIDVELAEATRGGASWPAWLQARQRGEKVSPELQARSWRRSSATTRPRPATRREQKQQPNRAGRCARLAALTGRGNLVSSAHPSPDRRAAGPLLAVE
jgi:hypothetical protein